MASPSATAASSNAANPSMGQVPTQPQTTGQSAAAAPFVRLSRRAQNRAFQLTGVAFGTPIVQKLNTVGGYVRRYILTVVASGGVATGVITNAADAPWTVIQTLMLRDSRGVPIIQIDGYGLYLVNKYSGQVAEGVQSDPTKLPSYTALNTTQASAGGFAFKLSIPLELDQAAYCSLTSQNATAPPELDITVGTAASVYGATVPQTTLPTMQITCEQEFWATPLQNSSYAPPDVGSSAQWQLAPGNPSIGTGAQLFVNVPNVGTWIHTLIAVLRDNTGARVDNWPLNDLAIQVDGTPVEIELFADRVDKMSVMTDGIVRDTGAIAYTFRNAVKPIVSNADTHDLLLPTTPATLLQVGGTFQAIGNSPATITFYVGKLFPRNAAKIPYTHLSE